MITQLNSNNLLQHFKAQLGVFDFIFLYKPKKFIKNEIPTNLEQVEFNCFEIPAIFNNVQR